jgi:hypothetical protein
MVIPGDDAWQHCICNGFWRAFFGAHQFLQWSQKMQRQVFSEEPCSTPD